ncbi:lycopene cyclase domain-containing protein [Brachybacterium saurashtrense]|uniref:Lycopene cyclase domain-containing protein n=1 Tax=Brachybacterium saurashtrense TaxID=556288 RepID=A0A345YSV4_9MICO|nr:lycopene cyclase domain-containing protein [Brachybacterium saurashtrense]AXK47006.1 lycopene cyclase domain-containing protein [Brachybacterium saurashtrense]RRR22721.1 lycopene cyclase domain-containing protein [Brachybacterium saurashtrense]
MSYAMLAGLFLLVPLLVLAVTVVLRRPGRRWWATTAVTIAVLLMLTAVFDSLMIAADLFRFAGEDLLGPRLGLAPVEDLAWPLAAGLLLPSLWLLLGPQEER